MAINRLGKKREFVVEAVHLGRLWQFSPSLSSSCAHQNCGPLQTAPKLAYLK